MKKQLATVNSNMSRPMIAQSNKNSQKNSFTSLCLPNQIRPQYQRNSSIMVAPRLFLLINITIHLSSAWNGHRRVRRGINFAPLVKEGVTGKEEIADALGNKAEFDKFKAAVLPKLKAEWMKKDVALVKYFNAAGKTSTDSVGLMDAVLEWRKEHNMDSILHDEDIKKHLPLSANPGIRGKDIMGRLVFYEFYGIWKFNEAMENGTETTYERTLYYSHEKAAEEVIMAYEAGETQYSRVIGILDFENWQMQEFMCPGCTPIIVRIGQNFDKMYPHAAHRWLIIRAPVEFDLFLDLVRIVLSRETNEALTHYGRDRKEWEPELKKLVDGDLIDKMMVKGGENTGFEFPGVQTFLDHSGK